MHKHDHQDTGYVDWLPEDSLTLTDLPIRSSLPYTSSMVSPAATKLRSELGHSLNDRLHLHPSLLYVSEFPPTWVHLRV